MLFHITNYINLLLNLGVNMWVHNLNPTLLHVGSLEIRYYGLVYLLGFFLAIAWLQYWRKKGELELSKDDVWDFVFYLMLGVVIGSRLFMIFWEPSTYLSNPLEIFMFWHGGMSFHGGLAGIIVAAIIYCKVKKINFYHMADLMSVPTMLALALGRVANFVNGELVGRVTDLSCCVQFPGYSDCRHPSTLYAAGKRFIVFFGLVWLSFHKFRKNFQPGFIFWNMVFWEGLGRIIVDFYREDILYWGFSLGQWFSLVMVLVALTFFYKNHRSDWKTLLIRKK
jgi:phosphatidylglycerol---prolipoprotein diacylglyceryl transferase